MRPERPKRQILVSKIAKVSNYFKGEANFAKKHSQWVPLPWCYIVPSKELQLRVMIEGEGSLSLWMALDKPEWIEVGESDYDWVYTTHINAGLCLRQEKAGGGWAVPRES